MESFVEHFGLEMIGGILLWKTLGGKVLVEFISGKFRLNCFCGNSILYILDPPCFSKHCQRHSGPRILSPKLGLSLKAETNANSNSALLALLHSQVTRPQRVMVFQFQVG